MRKMFGYALKSIPATMFLLLACSPAAAEEPGTAQDVAPEFTLVDENRQAVIVGTSKILQNFIEQSTGRKLQIVAEKDYNPEKMPLALFDTTTAKGQAMFGEPLKGLDPESYVIHVEPSCVVLAGSASAHYDFLRTGLGIDSYVPARLFTIIPKHPAVKIPVGTRLEKPVFFSRAFSGLNTNNGFRSLPDIPWRIHTGHGRYGFHHNIHSFIRVEEFAKDHPEYFPEQNGARVLVSSSAGPGPCISNPDVVAIVIRKCREFFDKNPHTLGISLGMTDGGYCECANCQAMDGKSLEINGQTSRKSNRYYAFLNQVARALQESHRGKFVGTLGYAGAELPPSFPVERNIIVYHCYNRANWANPADKAADLALLDAWMERTDRIGIYEYLYGMGFTVPRLYSRRLAEMLRHIGNRCPGSGFYAEIYSHHGLDGPKAWITEKLLWNPNQDVDRLMAEWAAAVFGPAAGPMKDYFDLLEATWIKNSGRAKQTGKFWGYNSDEQMEMFLPEDLPALWQLLEEAHAKTDSDIIRQRIDYFSSTLKITDVAVRHYHAYTETMALLQENAEPGRVLEALLRADRNAPEFDLGAYIGQVIASDPTKFVQGVPIARATKAAQYIFDRSSWEVVYQRLKAGERDPAGLSAAARDALLKIAPKDYEKDPVTKARMGNLLKLAECIAVAKRTAEPPEIDGVPAEACWSWVEQSPWFAHASGAVHSSTTHFAWAYDDQHLYLALRCPQPDLQQLKAASGQGSDAYGCPAWKFPSVEVFLNPDARDADPAQVFYYQVIPTARGGLWETGQKAMSGCKVSDNGKDQWQTEIALSWEKLNMRPKQFPYLRMNLVRNMKDQNARDVGCWFLSARAHKDASARGWLILDPSGERQ